MNKLAIVYVIVLTTVIMLLFLGCATGVSQEEYDKVSSDLTAAQAEISALKSRIQDLCRTRPTTAVEVTKDVEYGRGGNIPLFHLQDIIV